MNNFDLQLLRDAQVLLLTGQCTIWRNTPTVSATGGLVDSWAEVGTYACRLSPEHDRRLQQVIGEKETLEIYYRLTLPHNANLQAGDKVEYGSQMYTVAALWDSHTYRTAIRAIVSKVK